MSPTRTNPFPGLRPFELDEEHLFFGREGQADDLLERLNRNRFLAIVGVSGSGKSSLVRAGLLPSLYSGFLADASSHWRVAIMRPGDAPIRNLAAALNQPGVLDDHSEPRGLDEPTPPLKPPLPPAALSSQAIHVALTETTLRRGYLGLVEVVRQARIAENENLLVVVDQFEELFRFKLNARNPDANDEAAAFVKLLLTAAEQTSVSIYIVLTMRSDFLGDCAQFRNLPEALNDGQHLIPKMTRDQQRSAIEGPVAVGGAEITPQLVNRLLNDMGDNPDQLPILQHALMRTWDYWVDHHDGKEPIDLRHYRAIGGMAQALSQHADEIYHQLPDQRCREITEKLFKCLTDKGPDNREVRRPTKLSDVCAAAATEPEEVIAIVERFRGAGKSFLMPPAGVDLTEKTVLDISHESLMRVWRRLKDWVDQEAQSAQIYRRLAETAAMHQQDKAGFLRDPELTIGLNWRQETQPNAAWAKRYAPAFKPAMQFLDASAEARDAEVTAKELARRREVRRLRSFIAGLAVLALLAIGAAGYAYLREQDALTAKKQALDQEQKAKDAQALAQQRALEAKDAQALAQRRAQEAIQAKDIEAQQRELAENAKKAEAEQRKLAQQRQQQAEVARKAEAEQRMRAEEALQRADERAINSDIFAQSLAAENLLASNRELEALIASIDLGRQVKENQSRLDKPIRMRAITALREVVYGVKERNRLEGHGASVRSVSFSPDGQTLASASADHTVKLWNLQGQLLNTLEGHGASVRSVSFSPDGQTLASTSDDNTVKLWDLQGQLLNTLEGHGSSVWSVSFSPDGQTLASASADNTVKLWDLQGQLSNTLEDHDSWVLSVSFSPDGQTLVSASADNTVKFWDLQGQLLNTLEGHGANVSSVSFSPDGQTLASASDDNTIKLWDLQGQLLNTLEGHGASVWSVSFSPDGQTLASASADNTIKLWDLQGQLLNTLEGHGTSVWSVSFSPDGQTLASASYDHTVKLWNLQGQLSNTLEGHSASVSSVSFSPDGQTLASASDDHTVKLWNLQGQLSNTLEGHSSSVLSVSFSPDGQTLASASYDNTVKLWDLQGQLLNTLEGHGAWVLNVSFSPDGQTLASASYDNTIKLWNLQGQLLNTLEGHGASVWSVSFSPDGQTLASASYDNTVKLWNLQGELLNTLEGHGAWVRSVSFSPNGQTLASASDDNTVKLWDLQGQLLNTLEGHGSWVLSISFSPDGQTLASASADNTVKLWDLQGNLLNTLEGHGSWVLSVSFSPDGQTLTSASDDNTVKLWNFNLDDLLDKGCRWLQDYLTTNLPITHEKSQLCGITRR